MGYVAVGKNCCLNVIKAVLGMFGMVTGAMNGTHRGNLLNDTASKMLEP